MNIVRSRTEVQLDVPTVDSDTEAKQVMDHILAGKIAKGAKRDAANGLVEAYFVSTLRNVHSDRLGQTIRNYQTTFGTFNPFKRALARVKEFRGDNRCWNSIRVG